VFGGDCERVPRLGSCDIFAAPLPKEAIQMSSQEFDEKMAVVTATLDRLAAAQEQDRRDRVEFEQWAKTMLESIEASNATMIQTDARLARLFEWQTQLLALQSERMDRMDQQRLQDAARLTHIEKVYKDLMEENRDLQRQTLHLLNLILDRLPPFQIRPPDDN
jgi:hypothetical protein